jgi:uncharacterized protein YbaR (Trm112 family)
MALEGFLLDLLVCPETRANLALASPDVLKVLNAAAEKGTLTNRGGHRVARLDAALVRQDNEVAYPVRDDIPLLLLDEQIALRGLK